MINRAIFFNKIRPAFGGRISVSQKQGLETLLNVYEKTFSKITSIPQLAYELGTTHHESASTMQPIKEYGGPAYFKKMYDIQGSRPQVAKTLGNIYPGDGAKFPGMGYVQNTGRGNARKATKRLREMGIIDDSVDLEKNPELQMEPPIAAAIMFVGMEEGWFTGRNLDKIIDDTVDGDEHSDFVKARAIINGKDRAEAIANHADKYLIALVAAVDDAVLTEEDKEIINVKKVNVITMDDLEEADLAPAVRKKKNQYNEGALTEPEIRYIQTRLRNLGYLMVGKIDGKWSQGGNVTAAISALQQKVGLEVDGHYGPDTKEALNRTDGSNVYVVAEARKNSTAETIRASGSRTIAATDSIKSTTKLSGAGLALIGVANAVVTYAPDALTWITPIRSAFNDIPGWAWIIVGLIVCYIMYKNANKAEKARVDDEQTGKNVGHPDPAPSPPVTAIDSKADIPEGLPKFLQKAPVSGEHEVDVQVTK